MIYFDQAATTLPKPEAVARACAQAVLTGGNGGRGGYNGALDSLRTAYGVRCKLAGKFGLSAPERVCFTAGATDSLNIALQGLLRPGDHVITTAMEHNSVLRPLYLLEERGVELTILPADARGRVHWEALEPALRHNTRALVCCHGSNLTGNLNDLAALGAFCRGHGLTFVVDAAQTGGLFPIHMEGQHIGLLCLAGHKSLMGPQGIGALLVGPGVELRPLRVGGTGVQSASKRQPEEYPIRLEAGTLNGPGIAGLGAALDWLEEQGPDRLRRRERELARRFYQGAWEIPGVTVYGDFAAPERCPIVSLNLGEWDSAAVSDQLSQRFGVATRAGLHCAPLAHRALGTWKQGAVRFSFSHCNTEAEIDQGLAALRTLATE